MSEITAERDRGIEAFGTAEFEPGTRTPLGGGDHRGPGVECSERRVGPGGDRNTRVDEPPDPVERGDVVGIDVAPVVVASFEDEVRLADDGNPEPAEVRERAWSTVAPSTRWFVCTIGA